MAAREAVYTHGQHESVVRSYRWRTVENSAGYLIPHLAPGQSVLDVGCGPGAITAGFAARVAPGRVTALDASPEALEQARRTLSGVDNVSFAQGDVHHLDYPDATFDVVHAHQVLQHVTDPVAALREMARVCRPGGIVGARDADYAVMCWYPEIPALADWLELYRRVARHNGGEPDAGRRLLAWAHAAGLRDVTCTTDAWTFAMPEERAWWAGVWADRMTVSAVAEVALRDRLTSQADLDRIVAGWHEWASAEDGWFAVVHGQIVCRV